MKKLCTIVVLIVGMALMMSIGVQAAVSACGSGSGNAPCVAMGTVTRANGSTFFLLGSNNIVFTVNSDNAVWLGCEGQACEVRVGDVVRVYGHADKGVVQALRVRVLRRSPGSASAQSGAGPDRTIKVIVEREPEARQSPSYVSPAAIPPPSACPPAASEGCAPGPAWEGRGLITQINYDVGTVTVRTSQGAFNVIIAAASIVSGGKRVGLGRLNEGDAVGVTGYLVGMNQVDARVFRVLRTRSEAENALPQEPISIVGIIQQVDYASMTFKMSTEISGLVVMCDTNTMIQHQDHVLLFADLRPGMRIKMSGYGAPASGYMANHIMVIGVSP